MTLDFIVKWKRDLGCKKCRKIPGKTMCAHCRRKAVIRWHAFVKRRQQKGFAFNAIKSTYRINKDARFALQATGQTAYTTTIQKGLKKERIR